MSQQKIKFVGKDKAEVFCPIAGHGWSEISRAAVLEALQSRLSPCPACQGQTRTDTDGGGNGQPDKFARKHAGWRMLNLRTGHLYGPPLTKEQALDKKLIEEKARGARVAAIYFPNKLEANSFRMFLYQLTAKYIGGVIYQPPALEFPQAKKFGIRRYFPDFVFWSAAENPSLLVYVECKGRMDPKSLTKLRAVRDCFPGLKMKIITSAKVIEKFSGEFPENWEWRSTFMLRSWASLCPHWEK